MRQRGPSQLDHYYWLTASLAAHDMQKSACRVVAAIIVCLGAIPPTLMASPVGPQGLPNRALAVSVAICCLVLGALWLRQRWPHPNRIAAVRHGRNRVHRGGIADR